MANCNGPTYDELNVCLMLSCSPVLVVQPATSGAASTSAPAAARTVRLDAFNSTPPKRAPRIGASSERWHKRCSSCGQSRKRDKKEWRSLPRVLTGEMRVE